MMRPKPKSKSQRQGRQGLILSLAAWAALGAAPARSAPDLCSIPMLVEFQTVSTNQIKTGQAGFWSRTNQPGNNPPRFYRTNTIEVSEHIMIAGSQFVYASTLLTTQWVVFPTHHYTVSGENDFGCPVVSPVSSRRGSVQHGGSYVSGCGECEASLVDDEWVPDNSCPECHAVLVDDATRNWHLTSTFSTNETQFIETRSYQNAGGSGSWAYSHHYSKEVRQTLSGEYTTDMLLGQLRQDLASLPWPDDWSSHGLARLDLSLWEKCAQATRMRYRIRFIGPKAQAGEVAWTERFIPASGGAVLDNRRLVTVTFTGDEQVIERVIEPPARPGTVVVITPPWQTCSGCGLGQAEVDLEERPQLIFGLGQQRFGSPAGFLYLDSAIPTAALATPKALKAFVPLAAVEVVTNASGLRQVKTSQALVDIQNTGSHGFTIDYYLSAGLKDGLSGLYPPRGESLARWTLAQTSEEPYTLRVSSSGHGETDFIFTEGAWTLRRAGESLLETSLSSWDDTGQLLTNLTCYHRAGSPPVYQEAKVYTTLPNRPNPVLLQQVIGAGSAALTNAWLYEDTLPVNHVNYGKPRMILSSDGAWERYEYDPEHGRLRKIIAGFLNSPPHAPETECRVWVYDYTPLHPGDRGGWGDDTPRTVVEQLCGSEVARHYLICTDTERREIQCQTPGASWDAPDNLVTLSKTIVLTNGLEERVVHPDGTVRLTRWETNDQSQLFTRTTEQGQPAGDVDPTTLLSGTREVAVHDSNGLATAVTRTDIASHIVLASRRMHYDPLNRLVRQENLLDSTDSEYRYDCCSLLWSRDADGVATSYTYDEERQLRTRSQHGIIVSNVYHGPGLLAAQWRIGTDGSAVRLRANQYDLAGRLIAQTNALNQVTRYFYATDPSGRTSVRTVHPDGAWEIQYHHRDGSPAEVAGDAIFPVRHAYGLEQDRGVLRPYEQEIRLQNEQGTEWSKTLLDMAGRPYKTIFASAPGQPVPAREFFYNRKGQLEKETDPDGVTHLFSYGVSGRLELAGVDRDGDGRLTPDGRDRQEQFETRFTDKHGVFVEETSTWSWPSNGIDTKILRSCIDRSVDGLQTWIVQGGLTNQVSIRHDSPTLRIVTVTTPDGTAQIHTYQTGRLASVHRRTADRRLLAATNYSYDAHGRQAVINDLLGRRVTRLFYDPADQVISNVLSAPGLPAQITVCHYDARGRPEQVQWPDGTSTTHQYHPNGQLRMTSGSRTPTVEYAHDQQGRLTTLRTWRSPGDPSSAAITTWQYDPYRGFLLRKTYADGKGPRYNYSPAGRLLSRLTPRQKLTVYLYNRAGELVAKKYSDPTPNIAFSYDRTGRLEAVVQGTNSTRLSHSQTGQLLEEQMNGGILAGSAVVLAYDDLQRPVSVMLGSPPLVETTYAYTSDSRVAEVSSGEITTTYRHGLGQVPATNLVFHQGGQAALTVDRTFDALERVREIMARPAAAPPFGVTYQYDAAGQRTRAGSTGGAYWAYQYDARGEVVVAGKFWPDGQPVAGRQFRYAYDHLGNRTQAGLGGNPWGRGLRFDHYAANPLNQYEHRDVAGILDVSGTVHPGATVFVNDHPAQRRADYYWAEIPADNSAGAVYLCVSNVAVLRGETIDLSRTLTGRRFLPRSPETFLYDADGNLVQDGRWSYAWDAENRLIAMESLEGAPPASRRRLTFAYDWQGRRILKVVHAWKDGAWVRASERKFVHQGWQVLAELDGNKALVRAYVWGPDRSGRVGGAAGVGGLLAARVWPLDGAERQSFFYACDASDHVVALIRAEDGRLAAEYEYGPFGELFQKIDPSAGDNPFQFSTHYLDRETGLIYCGHRYYDPVTGRWLSRDPMEEQGGLNLYGYVENDPVHAIDPLGLEAFSSITVKRKQVMWLALLKASLGKKPAPDDPYGHWWIEFDGQSYGWWPEDGVTLIQTLRGVPGMLNGTLTMHGLGLASATRDGHHGDPADLEFAPRRRGGILGGGKIRYGQAEGKPCKCAEETEIKNCLRAFAQGYGGSWSYPWGQNCHSFQRSALRSCCLKQ